MTDKIKFVDISYLEKASNQLESKRQRGIFTPRYVECHIGEDFNPDIIDVLPYVELTRFQCQIIRDNIVEVIRFADTGRIAL